MKKDNLEQFIQGHRDEFDKDVPSLKIWYGIEKELDSQQTTSAKRFGVWRAMRIAAAVVFLLVTGGIIGSLLTQQAVAGEQNFAELDIESIAPELGEMEAYYQSQVQEKIQVLATYDEDPTLQEDLEELDAWREELKQDLIDAPKGSEEEIINGIISSYQAKIDILERVLNRIEAASNQNSTKNEVSI